MWLVGPVHIDKSEDIERVDIHCQDIACNLDSLTSAEGQKLECFK